MNVAGILSVKGTDIVTAKPGQTLREIAAVLARHKIGAIVVIDEQQAVCGIFSERDLVRAIAEDGNRAMEEPLQTYMTRDVVTCAKEDTVAELMTRMTDGRFRHLPVLENDRLIGIISIGDVVKRRIAETELEVEAMKGYIASG